jgi:hypothetical protein
MAALVLVLAALVVVVLTRPSGSTAAPTRSIGSMFEDDDHLLYAPTATVIRTLNMLKALGVNQVRATVLWYYVAPDPASSTAPPGFNAANPAAYPAANWKPYDRLVELAQVRGITVDFSVTAPWPEWSLVRTASGAEVPSRSAFAALFRAVGKRYSGRYVPPGSSRPLPRVSFWSIWNEPNQPSTLAPQWVFSSGRWVMVAPLLYRSYVDGAFAALARTGHSPRTDTILVGDLAPEGCVAHVRCGYPRRSRWPIPPLPFLRALYCVGSDYRPLRGRAAAADNCPLAGGARAFVSAHPGLFEATGFGEHPYSFFLPPAVRVPNPQFAPLADIDRLEAALDAIFRAYGVARRLPLYLDEYGYNTYPPNPYHGVSPALQALYLEEAEYMAWRDPRVMTLSQFELYDSLPDPNFPRGTVGYWSTSQTGLVYADGVPKPSLVAYRLPIFLPDPVRSPGRPTLVWAMLRAAPRNTRQSVQIQWRPAAPGSAYRTVRRALASGPSEVLVARVAFLGPGYVRVRWRSPSGRVLYSREAVLHGG